MNGKPAETVAEAIERLRALQARILAANTRHGRVNQNGEMRAALIETAIAIIEGRESV